MAVSLQQARQELNQASGGSNNNEWLTTRSDDEVRSEYKKLTGNDVEGASPGTAGNPVGGDVAGGYGFLPILLQLLQGAIQSGQFQQTFGENQRQFNESLTNMQNQFGQNLNLQTGNLTGYLPSGNLPRGGYDEAVNWYNRFKQIARRNPTREEWISGVANTLNITTPAAALIYDQGTTSGTAPGGGGSPTGRIPNRQEFADLLAQATSRFPGNPSLQREQFEADLALKLATLDRTNPYAARAARLGLAPGLEEGAQDIFARLQGRGSLPQYGQSPVPNPGNRIILDPREWRGFPPATGRSPSPWDFVHIVGYGPDGQPQIDPRSFLPVAQGGTIPDDQWAKQMEKFPTLTNNPAPAPGDYDSGTPFDPNGTPSPVRNWHLEIGADGTRWIVNNLTGARERDTVEHATVNTADQPGNQPGALSQADIPTQGQQIDYGRLRNLLPSELETVATDLRAKGINPEDYFSAARRALPSGLPVIGATRYI